MVKRWDQYKACEACPAGYFSGYGASACDPCPAWSFRAYNSSNGCQNCSGPAYPINQADPSSCVACNESCATGFNQLPCPGQTDFFICELCPSIPSNSTPTVHCGYMCNTGFYNVNNTCLACATGPCPTPGYNRSGCSDWADSNCDTPCDDPDMPPQYAEYTVGCEWACLPGYTLYTQDYVWWTKTACVVSGAQVLSGFQ